MEKSALKKVRFSHLGNHLTDPVITRIMAVALNCPNILSLAAGFTDNTVLPVELVRSVVEELTQKLGTAEYLQYGTNAGRTGLRESVACFLATYGGEENLELDADGIIITNGSQQALYLAVQVLCDSGDIILVEQPTYFVFLETLKGLRVRPLSIPVRREGGIDFNELRSLLTRMAETGERDRLKAVYLVTYYANPSSRCMPEEEKQILGHLLQSLDFTIPVIEDAAYRELYFKKPYPARSILSLPEFTDLPRLYAGTFTKPFATGLKVGFACCTDPLWLKNILRMKGFQDFGTANFNQAIMETVVSDGRYADFLKPLRPHYQGKMRLLHEVLLAEGLAGLGWQWEVPEGGLLLWLRGPEGLDTGIHSAFSQACMEERVLYVPGDLCFADAIPRNYVRLSTGILDSTQLEEAAQRFVRAACAFAAK